MGYTLDDLAGRLRETIPHLISLPYSPSDSANQMLALVQDLLERVAKAQRIARQQREELARAKEEGATEGGVKESGTKESGAKEEGKKENGKSRTRGKGSKATPSRAHNGVEMANGNGAATSDKGAAASEKSFKGLASDTFTPKRKQLPPSLALPQGLALPVPKEGAPGQAGAPRAAVPKLSTMPGHIRV